MDNMQFTGPKFEAGEEFNFQVGEAARGEMLSAGAGEGEWYGA
jgi:hypothetical protein